MSAISEAAVFVEAEAALRADASSPRLSRAERQALRDQAGAVRELADVTPGLRVFTGPYSMRDPDRLDITRAGCDRAKGARKAAPGEILAPSAALVFPALARMKAATSDAERETIWQEYREWYFAEMRTSYALRRAEWESLLRRERVVLVCFCRDPRRCHRSLAAEILAKLGAVNEGETVPARRSA